MNEHDDIAQWFARDEQPAPSDAFAAAVRQKVDQKRRRAKLVAILCSVACVLTVAIALLAMPFDLTYPLRLVQQSLTSPAGMLASAVCALALTAWLRFAEG